MMLPNEIIKEYRKKLKISQEELSIRTGVKRSYIAKIESGNSKKVSHVVLKKICRALKMPFEEEYNLYKLYNYTDIELMELGIINDTIHYKYIVDNDKIKKCSKKGYVNIIKTLENYKKNQLNLEETIDLVGISIGFNLRLFIDDDDIKKYKLEKIIKKQ